MYPRLTLCSAALALAGMASAQQTKPAEAAKSFSLELPPAPDAAATPTPAPTPSPTPGPAADPTPTPVPPMSDSPPPSPAGAAVPPAVRAVFTLDTPIQDLIANPAAKAVLDKDLPGMSDDENLDKFKALSLKGFQPLTGGQLTDAMLAKVAGDLSAIVGGEAVIVPMAKAGNSKRNKDDSR